MKEVDMTEMEEKSPVQDEEKNFPNSPNYFEDTPNYPIEAWDVEDAQELVPFLDSEDHNSASSLKDEKVSQNVQIENSDHTVSLTGNKENSEDVTWASGNSLEENITGINSDSPVELNDSSKIDQAESGTYEFRSAFHLVKLTDLENSNEMHDQIDRNGELDEETRENSFLEREYAQLQISQDYNFLVESLDASMNNQFSILNSNLTSSTCEDALSILMMKRSINEPIGTLNYFEFLPIELIIQIFSYFSPVELCRYVSPVCRQWRELSRDQSLWKCIDFTEFKHLDSLSVLWVVRRAPLLQKVVLRGRLKITMAELAIIFKLCPGIVELDLGFCNSINCYMVRYIVENCLKLKKLNVEGCQKIDSKGIRLLTKCENLSHLNLSHCVLSSSSLKYLFNNIQRLISINLDGISFMTDSDVETMVLKHQTWLQEVEIDGAEISDISMMYLSKCSLLKRLSMSFCECLTDEGLMYLKKLKNLEVLRVRRATDFSVSGMISFFQGTDLSKLYSLNMAECTEITDTVVLEIVKSCGRTLRDLTLCWCWSITEKGLISIVDHCSELRVLDLLGIDQITGECLARVPEEMEFLRFLDLQQCHKIIDSLLFDLVRRKPNLKILNYYGEEICKYENADVSEQW